MLITTFKTTGDLYNLQHNPFWFYEPPTLEHVHRLFTETLYGQWLLNTAFVGAMVVAITLALAVPAGYAPPRLSRGVRGEKGVGLFPTPLLAPTPLLLPPPPRAL